MAHFSLIPGMVAATLLVLTTGRATTASGTSAALPVTILACPVPFPRMRYYQLWHERTHGSASARWLREQVKSVASKLLEPPPTKTHRRMTTPRLHLSGITKRYPAVVANSDVSLTVTCPARPMPCWEKTAPASRR